MVVQFLTVMDFNSFVAWIGIVGFTLAIPMSVLANLLTPRIQNWWSTTSQARKNKRIEELKAKIKLFSGDDPLFIKIECISQGLYYAARGILEFFGIVGVAIGLLIGGMIPSPTHVPDWIKSLSSFWGYATIVLMFLGLNYINYRATRNVLRASYYFRISSYRLVKAMVEGIQKELNKLVDNSNPVSLPKP